MTPPPRTRTAALLAPSAGRVPADVLARVRGRLVSGVADASTGLPVGASLEVGLPLLRRARYQPEALARPAEPFAWKPAFVRRSLGLEAVRACAAGRFPGPSVAVGPLAERAVQEWRRTGWRTLHWEPWFAGLGPAARAAVLAEAVGWATPVWAAFDWAVLAPVADIGGADDVWSCPVDGDVRLKGRSELRVRLDGRVASGAAGRARVSVSGGRPGDGWRDELAFVALVAGLGRKSRPAPSRVVGLWPEVGALHVVEIDEVALLGAVDRVVETVAVTVDVLSSDPVPAVA